MFLSLVLSVQSSSSSFFSFTRLVIAVCAWNTLQGPRDIRTHNIPVRSIQGGMDGRTDGLLKTLCRGYHQLSHHLWELPLTTTTITPTRLAFLFLPLVVCAVCICRLFGQWPTSFQYHPARAAQGHPHSFFFLWDSFATFPFCLSKYAQKREAGQMACEDDRQKSFEFLFVFFFWFDFHSFLSLRERIDPFSKRLAYTLFCHFYWNRFQVFGGGCWAPSQDILERLQVARWFVPNFFFFFLYFQTRGKFNRDRSCHLATAFISLREFRSFSKVGLNNMDLVSCCYCLGWVRIGGLWTLGASIWLFSANTKLTDSAASVLVTQLTRFTFPALATKLFLPASRDCKRISPGKLKQQQATAGGFLNGNFVATRFILLVGEVEIPNVSRLFLFLYIGWESKTKWRVNFSGPFRVFGCFGPPSLESVPFRDFRAWATESERGPKSRRNRFHATQTLHTAQSHNAR